MYVKKKFKICIKKIKIQEIALKLQKKYKFVY